LQAKNIARSIAGDISFAPTDHEHFHPRQQASITAGDQTIGFVGRLHPLMCDLLKLDQNADLIYLTLDLPSLSARNSQLTTGSYTTLQDQILIRDISFVMDRSQTTQELFASIQKVPHITDVTTFDVYQGSNLPDDKKAIAIQITIHHPDNALTNDQINDILDQAIAA
jgi:phenylalanyl-tRNA synthetase beta chain